MTTADDSPLTDAELDDLVSHILGLRKDFIQRLLRKGGAAPGARRKSELRELLRETIESGELTRSQIADFLDEVEPGGKQHVFLWRPLRALNDEWRDRAKIERRLRRRRELRPLIDAHVPELVPDELTLSSIRFDDHFVEITGVEARHYEERDDSYDRRTESEEGLPVHLRAYVEHVARSAVRLRWDLKSRHAALHITQATGRGVERDHYENVAERFAEAIDPWLDLGKFADVNLHKVIQMLYKREQSGKDVLTRSRRGRWATTGGSEVEVTSASRRSSFFSEKEIVAAVGAVASDNSGQSGNLFWLPDGKVLSEELHITILAADSRVHFMRPSTPDAVEHVIGAIRGLL